MEALLAGSKMWYKGDANKEIQKYKSEEV